MYIVTGAAGFIGSAILAKLNQEGIDEIIIVDDIGTSSKWLNLRKRSFMGYQHKDKFISEVESETITGVSNPKDIKAIIHMGACSYTTEDDFDYLMENNLHYSQTLARFAVKHGIRFIYASSAATYGDGSCGYSDQDSLTLKLHPLNRYGYSKQLFDQWVLKNSLHNHLVGLKFFNVYGPNEYHKIGMTSAVKWGFEQATATSSIKLFRSYRPEFKDGEQKRDFIYVKDCAGTIWWLLNNNHVTGIYNLGTGVARSWNDIALAIFAALQRQPTIQYVDIPANLIEQYQYFTEADLSKLRATGFNLKFHTLEAGVQDYIVNYLNAKDCYL